MGIFIWHKFLYLFHQGVTWVESQFTFYCQQSWHSPQYLFIYLYLSIYFTRQGRWCESQFTFYCQQTWHSPQDLFIYLFYLFLSCGSDVGLSRNLRFIASRLDTPLKIYSFISFTYFIYLFISRGSDTGVESQFTFYCQQTWHSPQETTKGDATTSLSPSNLPVTKKKHENTMTERQKGKDKNDK